MSSQTIFNMQLILGYVAWLLCFSAYLLPKLKSMDPIEAHRAIATVNGFRFPGASDSKNTSALLAVRRRLQSRWDS